ncbi:hypothetical protein M011DRAFT_135474 [Sporormia fimetaria CBS 119925]|uniref:Uncharacterized protein n=1 Tax=Sporormia fimetaria CBS 119925 TaxID=1340428 RepID=A0A6A6V8D5_9PLEO|nr:hypothetical protein M011DRAFT_135474 [Sporormia fimetaria CBS 119925]
MKNTIHPLLSARGKRNFGSVGAGDPSFGNECTGIEGGGGVCQEERALGIVKVTLAKGFGIPGDVSLLDVEVVLGREMLPRPALWRAIFVVSFANMAGGCCAGGGGWVFLEGGWWSVESLDNWKGGGSWVVRSRILEERSGVGKELQIWG